MSEPKAPEHDLAGLDDTAYSVWGEEANGERRALLATSHCSATLGLYEIDDLIGVLQEMRAWIEPEPETCTHGPKCGDPHVWTEPGYGLMSFCQNCGKNR